MNRFVISCFLLVLAGCAGSSTYNYKTNTNPYTVAGKTYYPLASGDGFSETGTASWYGPDFHGKPTASGETYNKYAFTAAHKTLPFGTRVNVKNLDNGLTTDVVINDRGPFKDGRIIDLSYSAANQINMVGTGTARVRIKSIGKTNSATVDGGAVAARTATQSQSNGKNYYVQVGTYSVKNNAGQAASKLSKMGYAQAIKQKNGNYVVVAGPYGSRARATSARDNLRKTYSGAFIAE